VKFASSILLSCAAHGILAAGIAGYLAWAPAPDELARLDLSSVDLSFADVEDDSAESQPVAPSAPSDPVPESKPPEPEPPPEMDPPKELPPDPVALKLPEPEEVRKPFETPEPKKVEETQETKETEETKKTQEPPRPASVATTAAAPRRARVDAPPRPRRAIKPDYPNGARQRGEQGDVVLEIGVTAEGSVDDVVIVSSCGFRELDEAAVRAVKTARFTPAKRDRKPVASVARITLTFKLK
jgi:periplasmic protein TonB